MPFQSRHCRTAHRAWSVASLWASTSVMVAAMVAGCATKPPSPPPPAPPSPAPAPAAPLALPVMPPQRISHATNIQDYRHDVATHLYGQNSNRIFAGKMPPLLYAVGVLQTDIDARGYVTGVRWMRAPSHAPEVMAEIERTVRQAAPYPAPVKMGQVTYIETWLWHKSGQFQLHTLSEGQF